MNLNTIDHQLTSLVFSLPHPPPVTWFFQFFSAIGSFAFIWIIISLYIIVVEEKRDKRFLIYFLTAVLASSFLVNIILKPLLARARPLSLINQLKDFSFPSGHATVAFAAATILSAFDKKRRWFFYTIAALIAFSRVYLGYHYLLDIIGGTLIGWFISAIILTYGRKIKRKAVA